MWKCCFSYIDVLWFARVYDQSFSKNKLLKMLKHQEDMWKGLLFTQRGFLWIVGWVPKWIQNSLSEGKGKWLCFLLWLGCGARVREVCTSLWHQRRECACFFIHFPRFGEEEKKEWLGFKVLMVKHQNGQNLYCNRYVCVYLVTSYWEMLSKRCIYSFYSWAIFTI